MRKTSATELNHQMWSRFEKDMELLQERVLEQNYGLARELLGRMRADARANSEALGDSGALTGPVLSPTDERRIIWGKVGQKLQSLLNLLEARQYGQVEDDVERFLHDVLTHTQAAIEAHNREQKNPS